MINEKILTKFREKFKDAVKELEAEMGLKIDLGNISYSETSFTAKLQVVDQASGISSIYEEEFLKRQPYLGLPRDLLGKNILIDGKEFIFKGLKPNARKKPVIIETADSKVSYVCTLEMLKNSLK